MKNPGRVWRVRGFLWREFSADAAATIFLRRVSRRGGVFRSAARGDKWHVRRSGKALAATRHKRDSTPAFLARRRCACASLRRFLSRGRFSERCPG